MPNGKYSKELAERARDAAQADGAIVLLFGGKDGDGLSLALPEHLREHIPGILTALAAQIRAEQAGITVTEAGLYVVGRPKPRSH